MDSYVFNIEFNRTGTTSLTKALNILGIKSLHYSSDESGWFVDNKNELEYIVKSNRAQNKKLFHGLDEKFNGFSDFNGRRYYKTLYEQYPMSKFILTTRPFEDWINSVLSMEKDQDRLQTTDIEHKRKTELTKQYFESKQEIREFFKDKPNCYLEMNIIEGDAWEVLCKFLGKDIPSVPFPNIQSRIYK